MKQVFQRVRAWVAYLHILESWAGRVSGGSSRGSQTISGFEVGRSIIVLAVLAAVATADEISADVVAARGFTLAKKACYACHGSKFNGSPDLNVLDPKGLVEHGYLDPQDLANSHLWQRVSDGEMPPSDAVTGPLSEEDKQIFWQWLKLGAPSPTVAQRPFVGPAEALGAIQQDLLAAGRDAPYLRYLTLWRSHNDWRNVDEASLALQRAAISKSLNSLSWEPEIVLPRPVDEHHTVFAIDLRDFGWTGELWAKITHDYPYGLRYDDPRRPELRNLDKSVIRLSGATLCHVRADWFIHAATRPPLYHLILGLPEHDTLLEAKLGVDVVRNFRINKIARAGFARSGVSTGNRLVERHTAPYGYYWKSYDFQRQTKNGNLFKLPLGPVRMAGREYLPHTFEHDGGELIFSLPNGLQGYMLVDGHGRRIDSGPIDVVRDSKETSGSPVVVNGVSCMHCHAKGMISKFRDSVRDGSPLRGDALQKVLNLYPEAEQMQALLAADQRRFLVALDKATAPFLPTITTEASTSTEGVEVGPEPVGSVVIWFDRDLNLASAAVEIGLQDPEQLRTAILHSEELARLGLMPLAQDRTIKRSEWEQRRSNLSPSSAQSAARALLGASPFRPL